MAETPIKQMLLDGLVPIHRELVDRLEGDLSEADACAVMTGFYKAAATGFRLGEVELAAKLSSSGVQVHVHQEISVEDEWGVRYGTKEEE